MGDLKKKIYENVCCFLVLLLVMFLVYLFATLMFAKSSPLLDFGPHDSQDGNYIRIRVNNENEVNQWIQRTEQFLDEFHPNDTSNRVACDFNEPTGPGKFCMINVKQWTSACSPSNGFGFKNHTPCVFLNLNPESDWLPDYFEKVHKLPKEMPMELRGHITAQHPSKLRQVWLSCVGKTEEDQKNMGKIHFVPWHGFPSFFYPARKNTPGYSKPFVAVHFENPTSGVDINVECRAWAKNIPKGSQGVEFKLHIDLHSTSSMEKGTLLAKNTTVANPKSGK